MAAPAKPENFAITNITDTTCLLSWDNVANESGYKIERSLDNENWVQIAVVEADVVSVMIRNLSPLTDYYFRIRAYNNDGDSAYAFEGTGASWRDDFDDGSIGVDWTVFATDPPNRTIVEAGEVLTAAVANGIEGNWFSYGAPAGNLAPRIYRTLDLLPLCEIITKINVYTHNNGAYAGIFIATTPEGYAEANAYLFGYFRDDNQNGHELRVCNLKQPQAWKLGPYFNVPEWLKIKIDASEVITFWWSEDGISYTQMNDIGGSPYSLSSYYTSGIKVGLFAANNRDYWRTDCPVSVPFEYFEITGMSAVPITTKSKGSSGGEGYDKSDLPLIRFIYKNRWRD